MVDRLTCPEGICCILAFIAGLTLWINAFAKWPHLSTLSQALMGGALFAFAVFVPAQAEAQTPMTRDQAEQEAKDLAAGLDGQIKAGASQTVDANTVPSFVTSNPAETSYYSNSHNLDSAGRAAISGSQAAGFVNGSLQSRPIITKAELDTWTSNGLAIEANAQSIVVEYTGAYGDCTTDVTGGTGDTTFSYSCDEGETVSQFDATCQTVLNVSVDVQNLHYCYRVSGDSNIPTSPEPHCAALAAEPTCGPPTVTTLVDQCGDPTYPIPDACFIEVVAHSCGVGIVGTRPAITTAPPIITDTLDTSACDVRETDPNCTFTGEVCVEPAATRIINGEAVTRSCWRTERSYQCAALGGSTNDCSPPAGCTLASSECLATDDATGACRTTEHTYSCTVPGTPGGAVGYCNQDVYCIAGDCNTIVREQNDEFPQAVSALSALGQLQNDVTQGTLEIFPGEHLQCSKAVAGLKNCCSNDGFLLSLGFSCSAQEHSLALRQREGQCHYVGTYCSKKTFFGVCLTKRRSHCCFNNKLARIIHEQGRPQIGFDWGDRKNPDCSGFTVAQFQALDLSTVDFSEFYDEVLASFTGPDTNAATTAITNRIINAYQCPPNCP